MKTLYDLKQSGCEWNIELNNQLSKCGYKKIHSDSCVYLQKTADQISIITVWVDDLMLFLTSTETRKIIKHDILGAFEVTDLGELSKIVGIEISHDRVQKKITITQTNYIDVILLLFAMKMVVVTFRDM